MTANILLQAAGIVVLGVLTLEVYMTALTMQGAGPLTGRLARLLWRGLLALHRRRANHDLLGLAGGGIAALTLGMWILALWAGWGLIFAGAPGSIVADPSGVPADLASRLYFAGFNIFTLGLGDYRPEGAGWQAATVLASASGLVAVTFSITYLLPILSQAVSRQALAGRMGLLGLTPGEVAASAAADPGGFDQRLAELTPDILMQARRHLAYPVLHYFHTGESRLALPLRIAVLREGVLIASEHARPSEAASERLALLKAVDVFIDSVASELGGGRSAPSGLKPEDSAAHVAPRQGPPGRAQEDNDCSRGLMKALVEHDGWAWTDVTAPLTRDAG